MVHSFIKYFISKPGKFPGSVELKDDFELEAVNTDEANNDEDNLDKDPERKKLLEVIKYITVGHFVLLTLLECS